MPHKIKKLEPLPFETRGSSNFLRMYYDMLTSPAWKSLSLRQRGLYLEFKGRYQEDRRDHKIISTNKDKIHFSGQEATKPGPNGELPLYGCKNQFYADLDVLISAGFIKVVSTGYFSRSATVYGLSERWKEYLPGKPPDVPLSERRIRRSKEVAPTWLTLK